MRIGIAAKGIGHLWPQLVVQALLFRRARELAGMSAGEIPVFGGYCHQHLIVHFAGNGAGGKTLHAAKVYSRQNGIAVSCMRKLLSDQLALHKSRGEALTFALE